MGNSIRTLLNLAVFAGIVYGLVVLVKYLLKTKLLVPVVCILLLILFWFFIIRALFRVYSKEKE